MRNTHDTGNVDMSDDKLDFLDGQPAEVTPEPVQQPEPQAEPKADKGEPPAQEPVSAPPAEPQKEQHVAPLTALLDEREKRQAAERELQELRAWRQKQEDAQRAVQAPDPRQDPEGALAYERAQVAKEVWNMQLNMSETLVRQQMGDQIVDEATAAFKEAVNVNSALYADMQRDRNPYAFVVRWYQNQKFINEVGNDPANYRARLEAEIREKVLAEMQAQPAQPKPRLPGSLAAAPAAGAAGEPASKGSAFDAAFG